MSEIAGSTALELEQRLSDAGAEAKKKFGDAEELLKTWIKTRPGLTLGAALAAGSVDRMADQATMNGASGTGGSGESTSAGVAPGGRASAAPAATASAGQVASNVAGFGENLLNMAELQVRMSAIELRQNVEAVRIVAAVGLTGAVLALAALPIVLAGIAELLVTALDFRRPVSYLLVGFATIGLGALCIITAGAWISRKRLGFPLSAEELARNLNWVRTVLRLSGRYRAHRG